MTLLVVIHVLICFVLVSVILLQPGKGDAGIGFGSSSQSIFGSKGASNFLTKTTSVCAMVFILTSFLLTRSRMREYNASVIRADDTTTPSAAPATTPAPPPASGSKAPAVPAAPAKAKGGGK